MLRPRLSVRLSFFQQRFRHGWHLLFAVKGQNGLSFGLVSLPTTHLIEAMQAGNKIPKPKYDFYALYRFPPVLIWRWKQI